MPMRVPTHEAGLNVPAALTQQRRAGVDLSEGLRSGGRQLQEWGAKLQSAKDEAALNEARLEGFRRLSDLELSAEQDEDYRGAPSRFESEGRSIGRELSERLPTKEMRGAFDAEFGRLFETKRIGLSRRSLERMADAQAATLDQMDDQLASYAASAPSAEERELAVTHMAAALDSAARGGWIAETEAVDRQQKFMAKIDGLTARALMKDDPDEAVEALIDPDIFPHLSNNQRSELLSWAKRLATTRRPASVEVDVTAAEREAAFSEGVELAREGKLTPEWAEDQRDVLSPAQLRAFREAGSEKPDPAVYNGYFGEVMANGLAHRDSLDRALVRGRLSPEQYERLLRLGEDEELRGLMRSGTRVMSEMLAGGLTSGRGDDARDALAAWLVTTDTRDIGAIERQARAIAMREVRQAVDRAPPLRFARAAPRTMDDLKRAQLALRAARDRGEITVSDLHRELDKIAAWRVLLTEAEREK